MGLRSWEFGVETREAYDVFRAQGSRVKMNHAAFSGSGFSLVKKQERRN